MNKITIKSVGIFLIICMVLVGFIPIYAGTGERNEENTIESAKIYINRLINTPSDILTGSTYDLLEYFLKSSFMQQMIDTTSIGSENSSQFDFSIHTAYKELLTRVDLLQCIFKTINESMDQNQEITYRQIKGLLLLLEQNTIRTKMIEYNGNADSYNMLIDSLRNSRFNPDDYIAAGYIQTVNGNSVPVLMAIREFTSGEIAQSITENYYATGLYPIYNPSLRYNCHSYAWYRYNTTNPYWISAIDNFLSDTACIYVSSTPQVKDIAVYHDGNGNVVHSGVVTGVNGNTITICSKWGAGGVYVHALDIVPIVYYYDPSGPTVDVSYYRYHDYTIQRTGSDYHHGSRHYIQYAETCLICGKQINPYWTSIPCSGPPCMIPLTGLSDYNRINQQEDPLFPDGAEAEP